MSTSPPGYSAAPISTPPGRRLDGASFALPRPEVAGSSGDLLYLGGSDPAALSVAIPEQSSSARASSGPQSGW